MGIEKGKPEGGKGGKLGHSNMAYWGSNDEAKSAARRRRRIASKQLAVEEHREASEGDDGSDGETLRGPRRS